ncbi:MAG: serine/threonine protein kinase [Candidatus Aenigmarchaeota archaeon]|nr:serine/threonine protein kinase [Candidatus Aenigmarchaeota archaeon]
MLLTTGTEIRNYRILEPLGSQGAMSATYLGMDTRLDRQVILKQLNRSQQNSDFVYQEGKILAGLKHPNIVTIYDLVDFDNSIFLVMEYVPGQNLRQCVEQQFERTGVGLGEYYTREFGLKLSSALEYLHNQKPAIVHRDVKPDNIFRKEVYGEGWDVLLGDFGIASLATDPYQRESIGTPHFVAPEQWTGEACTKSDVYSLSATLYYVLSGVEPAEDTDKFLMQLKDCWTAGGMTRGMCDVLTRSAQPSTSDRYSASEMFYHLSVLKDYTMIPNNLVDSISRPNLSAIDLTDPLIKMAEGVIVQIKEAAEPNGGYSTILIKVQDPPNHGGNLSYRLVVKKSRRSFITKLLDYFLDRSISVSDKHNGEIVHADLYPFDDRVVISYINSTLNGFKHQEVAIPIR